MAITPLQWHELYEKHNAQGIRVASAILSVGGVREYRDAAKDAAQEAWSIAWRFGSEYEHAKALFFRSIRFRAINMVRRHAVAVKHQSELAGEAPGLANPGWGARVNPALDATITKATCEAFETWYLHDVTKLSVEEVMKEQDINKSTFNNRLYKVRNINKK